MNQVKTEKAPFVRWCPGTAPCTLYNYFMTLSESSPPSVQRSRNTSFAFELIVIPLFKVRLIDETKDNISIYTAFCHVLLFQLNLSKGSLVLISVNSHLDDSQVSSKSLFFTRRARSSAQQVIFDVGDQCLSANLSYLRTVKVVFDLCYGH